jgi:hypothetical protein
VVASNQSNIVVSRPYSAPSEPTDPDHKGRISMATDTAHNTMPSDIAKAIAQAMSEIGVLAKANENKFDKYNFASIDDFILHVRAPMEKAGLFIIPDEAAEPELRDVNKKDGKPMAMWWSRFGFIIGHTSGALYGPIYKTVMVQANGAQAAGSAQSYALKQLLRGLFAIPTGDKDDPDTTGTEISAKGASETDLQRVAGRIRRSLLTALNLDELDEAWQNAAVDVDHIKRVSETAHSFLISEYTRKRGELGAS